eukprot:768518-Hanusia_phi.AAC.3
MHVALIREERVLEGGKKLRFGRKHCLLILVQGRSTAPEIVQQVNSITHVHKLNTQPVSSYRDSTDVKTCQVLQRLYMLAIQIDLDHRSLWANVSNSQGPVAQGKRTCRHQQQGHAAPERHVAHVSTGRERWDSERDRYPPEACPEFDAQEFVGKARRSVGLEELLSELQGHLLRLREGLVDAINEDYGAFVGMASSLKGLDSLLSRVRAPVESLRTEMMELRESTAGVLMQLEGKLEERSSILSAQHRLELLLDIEMGLSRMEALLMRDIAEVSEYNEKEEMEDGEIRELSVGELMRGANVLERVSNETARLRGQVLRLDESLDKKVGACPSCPMFLSLHPGLAASTGSAAGTAPQTPERNLWSRDFLRGDNRVQRWGWEEGGKGLLSLCREGGSDRNMHEVLCDRGEGGRVPECDPIRVHQTVHHFRCDSSEP